MHALGFRARIPTRSLRNSSILRLDCARATNQRFIDWEGKFWDPAIEIEPGIYAAGVDTTFALYRPLERRHELMRAVRTGKPYVARHLPWYIDSNHLSEEDTYYRDHADTTMSNWDRNQLPWWKQRRLGTLNDPD